jgi:DNA-binding transcriptional regulator LsrR (DeoR family)
MTSGFSVREPEIAPNSYISHFHGSSIKVDCVGLFAPAVVDWRDYASVKKCVGVAESFARAEEIQIVVTSFGSAFDDDGQFTKFMAHSQKGIDALIDAEWIGDILYRPFSLTGPITIDTDIRAMVVLELADLGRLAQTKDRHVVLLAGPCGKCKKPRTSALKPLLEQQSLEVWSHMVVDMTTANELLV